MAKKKHTQRFRLNQTDAAKWARNSLLFSAPAVLAFLISLQSGGDFHISIGMAYQAILASAIDITRKFASEK